MYKIHLIKLSKKLFIKLLTIFIFGFNIQIWLKNQKNNKGECYEVYL
jgi:hypothetical protein